MLVMTSTSLVARFTPTSGHGRNGMVGVNMTYRLAPQAKWPAAQEDIGSAIAWIKANAAAQGGDPNRIYLMGHSAGASHVANYMSHSQFRGGSA
jgi:triacylglycerol lipase